jgi:hypothetical protein
MTDGEYQRIVRELQRTRDHDAVTEAEGRSYRCWTTASARRRGSSRHSRIGETRRLPYGWHLAQPRA